MCYISLLVLAISFNLLPISLLLAAEREMALYCAFTVLCVGTAIGEKNCYDARMCALLHNISRWLRVPACRLALWEDGCATQVRCCYIRILVTALVPSFNPLISLIVGHPACCIQTATCCGLNARYRSWIESCVVDSSATEQHRTVGGAHQTTTVLVASTHSFVDYRPKTSS